MEHSSCLSFPSADVYLTTALFMQRYQGQECPELVSHFPVQSQEKPRTPDHRVWSCPEHSEGNTEHTHKSLPTAITFLDSMTPSLRRISDLLRLPTTFLRNPHRCSPAKGTRWKFHRKALTLYSQDVDPKNDQPWEDGHKINQGTFRPLHSRGGRALSLSLSRNHHLKERFKNSALSEKQLEYQS